MDDEPIINLTPLIDVVFVILIMFILIAPLLDLERVELAKASPHNSNLQELSSESPVTLHVLRNNTVLLNKELISMSELPAKLTDVKKEYPKAKPLLFHDKQGYFGTYQEVKSALESAGFEELDIVLSPG